MLHSIVPALIKELKRDRIQQSLKTLKYFFLTVSQKLGLECRMRIYFMNYLSSKYSGIKYVFIIVKD